MMKIQMIVVMIKNTQLMKKIVMMKIFDQHLVVQIKKLNQQQIDENVKYQMFHQQLMLNPLKLN
jgi:hypothetical protein